MKRMQSKMVMMRSPTIAMVAETETAAMVPGVHMSIQVFEPPDTWRLGAQLGQRGGMRLILW